MAYRVSSLLALALILFTPPFLRAANATPQNRMSCIRDIVTIVSGGGIVGVGATLWKLVTDYKSGENKNTVYSDLPRMPSSHLFQPRAEEMRELKEKFNTLEMTNPGDVVLTVYVTGDPASGKTQLAGQYGREFIRKNKHKNEKLFAGTLIADSRFGFLQKYLQIAHSLGCVKEETEEAIEAGQLDELASLRMLSKRVMKELKERPGWLLIIDGLSLDEGLVKELRPFWPQPNDENWGKGNVLVTTQGHAPTGPSIDMLDLRSGMSETDAVELLTKVSGCNNKEEAVDLVKSLDRSPLSVASAGVYIKNERLRKPSYSFKNYLETVVWKGIQDTSEQELQKRGQGPYIHTRKEAVSMTAKQIVSNSPKFFKVFILFAACAQAPVPLSLVARVLGVQPDNRELEDIRNCALLSPPSMGLRKIESVSVHQVTRSVFMDLFLRNISTLAGDPPTLHELLHFPVKDGFKDVMVEIQNDYVKLGIQLLQDDNGNIVEGIEKMKRGDPGDITVEILQQWLQGKGRKPVTWQTLVECLEATKLHVAANYIKVALNRNNSASFMGQQTASYLQNNLIHITDSVCQEYDSVSNNVYNSSDSFQMMKLLIPHMKFLLQIQFEIPDFHLDTSHEVKLRLALGVSYHHIGKNNEAREVLEKALEVCNKDDAKETKEGAEVARKLGWIYQDLGMFKESEHVLKEALDTFMQLCGEESSEVASVLNNLGWTYMRMHQFQKSRECYEHALEIHEKLHGHKHPLIAAVLANLGVTWKYAGNNTKAVSLYQEALAIQKDLHGPNHLEVAFTLHNLGQLLLGEHSIELLKRSLEIEKHFYGDDHPAIANTLIELSASYYDLGDIQKAKKAGHDAFILLQNTYNPLLMAEVQLQLGRIHLDLEEFVEARKQFQSSLETHKMVYGVEHDDTRKAHLGVAMAARLAGSSVDAKEILVSEEESLLGTQNTLAELGQVYLDLGYLTQSLQAHGRALNLDIAKELKANSTKCQIALRHANLAKALWETGKRRSGLEMMQRALKMYQQSTDIISEDVSVSKRMVEERNIKHVSMLVTMSQMFQDIGNLEEARGHLEDALQRLRQSLLSHNLLEATTLCTLGTVFHKLTTQTTTEHSPFVARLYTWYYKYKAHKLLNTALNIMRRVCNNHPNTATTLAAIGRLDLDSGDLYSAKLHLEEALDIQRKCCGYIHPNIALYYQLLAEVASQTGDELSAKSHSQEADKIYRALIKREEELSKSSGFRLLIIQKWQLNIGMMDYET